MVYFRPEQSLSTAIHQSSMASTNIGQPRLDAAAACCNSGNSQADNQ
jgi:hypothetical protein